MDFQLNECLSFKIWVHRKNSSNLIDRLIQWTGFVLLITATSLPQIQSTPICYGKVDLIFVIDASFSIKDADFKLVRDFVFTLYSKIRLDIGTELRTGVILYASEVYEGDNMINLSGDQSRIIGLLANFTRNTGNSRTFTGAATEQAYNMSKTQGRADAEQILVLITDGEADDPSAVFSNAARLREDKIHVLALGIGIPGENIDAAEMNTIASSPSSVYIFTEITPTLVLMITKDICGRTQDSKVPPEVIRDNVKMDIYFMLDEEMLIQDLSITKQFMKSILQTFEIGPGKASASVMLYGGSVGQNFAVNSFTTEASLFSGIDALSLTSGNGNSRNVTLVLMELQSRITSSSTTGPVIAVLFLTGNINNITSVIQRTDAFRKASNPNVYLIVIVIGANNQILKSQQNRMAYDVGTAFQADNFLRLSGNNANSTNFISSVRNTIYQLAMGTFVSQGVSYRWPWMVDLVFMVDGSTPMSQFTRYAIVKYFMKELVDEFELGVDRGRVAVFLCDAAGPYNSIRFDTYDHDHDTLNNRINNLQWIQRHDTTDNAVCLTAMRTYFLDNNREQASKVGYLVTLGQAQNRLLAGAETRALAYNGVKLNVIGINGGVQEEEVQSYQNFDASVHLSSIYALASTSSLLVIKEDLVRDASASRIRGRHIQLNDKFDLIVALHDESGRIDGGESVKYFLQDLFQRYRIGENHVLGGVITFGGNVNTGARQEIQLGSNSFYTALYLSIYRLVLTPTGGPNVLAALDALITMFQNHGRPNVTKVAMLITQGDLNLDELTTKIQQVRNAGISLMVVGIGGDADIVDLRSIAHNSEAAFRQGSFQMLHFPPAMDAVLVSLARGILPSQGTGNILRLPSTCNGVTGYKPGIVFLIDASDSIREVFEDVKKFVAVLMSGFTDVDVGALAFGTDIVPQSIIPIGQYPSYVELYFHFMDSIKMNPLYLTTGTFLAIQKMVEMFNNSTTNYTEKIGVLVTDGKSDNTNETVREADIARNANITLLAIGIGEFIFDAELDGITGGLRTGNVSHKMKFEKENLNNTRKLEDVQNILCALIRPGDCGAGNKRDLTSLECSACPVGTYQALSEQLFCENCETGKTTSGVGAVNSSSCYTACNAGYYLNNSTNTCEICPIGQYQPNSGQTKCEKCDLPTTTKYNGSRSEKDCKLEKCEEPTDLVLVVDATASIGNLEFNLLKAFLVNLLERFYIGSNLNETVISVVRLGSLTEDSDVTDFLTDKQSIQDVIRELQGFDLSTNTASAVEKASSKLDSDGRTNNSKVMFVVTDGKSQNPFETRYWALLARLKYKIVALGIGDFFLPELLGLASAPEYVLTESNFFKLPALDAYTTICRAARSWAPPNETVSSAVRCNLPLDLILVMHLPNNLKNVEFILMKARLANFVLRLNTTNVNIGVLSYAATVNVAAKLELSSNLSDIQRGIRSQSKSQSGAATGSALRQANSMLDSSLRSDAPKAVIILAFGKSDNYDDTITAANQIETNGIYAVSVGKDSSDDILERELYAISTTGSNSTLILPTLSQTTLPSLLYTKLCPEDFRCSYALHVAYIWYFNSSGDILDKATKFSAELSARFAFMLASIIEVSSSSEITTLLSALIEAEKQMAAKQLYDTIQNIIIITDKLPTDLGTEVTAVLDKTTALKQAGVKILIVNARTGLDVAWVPYATSSGAVFYGENFNDLVPAWKIHTTLCKEPCESGYKIGIDGRCEQCAVGTYRNKTTSYTCQTCSNDSTTTGAGSTSISACTITPGDIKCCAQVKCPQLNVKVTDWDTTFGAFVTYGGHFLSTFNFMPAPWLKCEKPMDLIFVIDATISIGINYGILKAFFWQLVEKFPVGLRDNETTIAIVKIGEELTPDDYSLLSQSDSGIKVQTKIVSLKGNEQQTNTAASLAKVYEIFQAEGRDPEKYPRIVLVATDGKSINTFQTTRYSVLLKLGGIRTLVISLGTGVFQPEIKALAYDEQSIFTFTSYRLLLQSNIIPEKICDAAKNYEPIKPDTGGPDLLGECKSYMDMVFVLDASLSVSTFTFLKLRVFIAQFAKMLDIGQDKIRISIMSYSTAVHEAEVFSLEDSVDQNTLEEDGIRFQKQNSSGLTNTADALRRMIEMFTLEGRPNLPYVGIVITDGKSNNPSKTKLEAQKAKDKGIHLVVIGYGDSIYTQELYDVATDPASVKVLKSFSDLTTEQLLDISCSYNFTCPHEMDIIAVWDLENADTIRRAEILVEGVKKSFGNSTVSNTFVDHVANVAEAVEESLQKHLNDSRKDTNVTRVIIVITDKEIESDVKVNLQNKATEAKRRGILVMVVDAAEIPNNLTSIASNDKLSYVTNKFDVLPHNLVLQRSLCTAPCKSGEEVAPDGSCYKCAVDKYRDTQETFQCVDCPSGRTTNGATGAGALSGCLFGYCGTRMDIVFVIDSSESISRTAFILMKAFLLRTIGTMDIGFELTRVGLMPFSSDIVKPLIFELQESTSQDLVLQAVKNLRQRDLPTGTNTSIAIEAATYMVSTQGRTGVFQIICVITDGISSNSYDTVEAAKKANDKFIRIYSLGVGPNIYVDELNKIASDPDSKMFVNDFVKLAGINNFTRTICEDLFFCRRVMDVVIFEDRTTSDSTFTSRLDSFKTKLTNSYNSSAVINLSFTSMAQLDTYVKNQNLSINPHRTKLFIFITRTDIVNDVVNTIIASLLNNGGLVAVINANRNLENTNFVSMVSGLEYLFNVENFDEQPAYRFMERKLCTEPCADGEQRSRSGSCEKCPTGTYRSNTDTHMCAICSGDKTTRVPGATDASDCIPNCGAGNKTVGEVCVACAKGEYQAENFQPDCDSCTSGYTTAQMQSTSQDQCIRDCDAGKKISPSNSSSCEECEENTYQPARAQTQCIACPIYLASTTGSTTLDNCNDACGKSLDIIFVVDASLSLRRIDFSRVKAFLENSIIRFKVSLTATRIGIIEFSYKVAVSPRFNLTESVSHDRAITLARSLIHGTQPGTNTAEALDAAVKMFEDQGRGDKYWNIVIVTDGKSDNTAKTEAAATRAKKKFINIITIGVGNNFFLPELKKIATDNTAVKTFSSFSALVGFNILPTVCTPTQFTCKENMDIFYIKHFDSTATVETQVSKFFTELSTRYKAGTNYTLIDANSGTESLNDDLNNFTAVSGSPESTKILIVFTNKINSEGAVAAAAKARGVIVAVVYASDVQTDRSFDSLVSNQDLLFYTQRFGEPPYIDFILRSLCIVPCSDGFERANTGQCTQCVKGEYRNATQSHVCEECSTLTTTSGTGATDSSQCVACPDASQWPCRSGNQCIDTVLQCDGTQHCADGSDEICNNCTKGSRWNGTHCVQCERGTFQPNDEQTECITCPEGTTTDGVGKVTQDNCTVVCNESGKELNYPNEGCVNCSIGYYRNKDEDAICIKCEDKFTTKNVSSTSKDDCIPDCDEGQFWDNIIRSCVDCQNGTYQTEKYQDKCETCKAGTTTNSTKSTSEDDCYDPCKEGEEFPADGTSQDDCVVCPVGQYKSSSNTTCQQCDPGYTTRNNGSTNSTDCLANCDVGSYFDDNLKKCQKCQIGKYQDEKYQKECKTCETGKTTNSSGSVSVENCTVPCAAGSVLPFRLDGSCTPCPQGSYRVLNETVANCTQCGQGESTDQEGSTSPSDCKTDCQPGQKITNVTCEDCEMGTYQTLPRQTSCVTCPNYTTTVLVGAASPDLCIDACPSGKELTGKDPLVCTKCEMNFYKKAGIDKNCTACPVNHITLSDGAISKDECFPNCTSGQKWNGTSCVDCEIGTFQLEFYQDSCIKCRDKWTTVNTGSKLLSDCKPNCTAGTQWNDTAGSCVDCMKDKFQPDAYQTECQKCGEGKFTDNTGATSEAQCKDQCQLGNEMGPGGMSPADCVKCRIGTYKNGSTSTCQPCPEGFTTLNNGSSAYSDCKSPCEEGQFFDFDLKICVECKVGTYQDQRNQMTCKECTPTGFTTTLSGSKNITDCVSPCRPGSAWNNGTLQCEPCKIKTYQDEANKYSCKSCPASQTTLSEGSDSETDCINPVCNGANKWPCDNFNTSSECIPINKRCDSIDDCADESDESNVNCCAIGQYHNETTNQCEDCPPGSYQDEIGQTTCLDCAKGLYSAAGSNDQTDCIECQAGYEFSPERNSTHCAQCPLDTYRESGMMVCEKCPLNFTTEAMARTSITDCKPNCTVGQQYNSSQFRCESCPVGEYQNQDKQTECRKCPRGTTTTSIGSTNANNCTDICYPGETVVYDADDLPTTECKPCPTGQYKNTSISYVCEPCPTNFTTIRVNSTECSLNCGPGHYSKNSSVCEKCEKGTYQPKPLQENCTSCDPGKTTPIVGATTGALCYDKCSDGYKYVPNNDSCTICVKGTFRQKDVDADCKSCKTGFTTEFDGAATEDDCVPDCPAGQFHDRDSSRCEQCKENTYQDKPYQYACKTCPAGTAVAATGSDEMSDCQDPCTTPGEQLQPDGSCGQCEIGTAKIPPSTVCEICPAGFTTATTGSTKCVPDCKAGSFSDGTKCTLCPKGSYQPNMYQYNCTDCQTGLTTANVGSTNISQCIDICPNGFELQFSGVCEPCEKNHYRTNGEQLQCTSCPPYFITFYEGSETIDDCHPPCNISSAWSNVTKKCEPCKIGFYQNETNQKECKSCGTGKITLTTGASSESECVGGCGPGTFWNESAGQCMECKKGTYQNQPYRDSCPACTPGYTTDSTGSKTPLDCYDKCESGYTYANGTCLPCGANKYRDRDIHNICQRCTAALRTVTNNATSENECISNCSRGQYFHKDKRVCVNCSIGQYQPEESALACVQCEDGGTTLSNGTIFKSDCKRPCLEGEEWDFSSKMCVPCPIGEYQDTKYQENCTKCVVGKSTQSIRSTQESDCEPTTCQPGEWRCLSGTGCASGSARCDGVTNNVCNDDSDEAGCDCTAGQYYDITVGVCKNCLTGEYQDQSGQLSCISCPVGFTTTGVKRTSKTDCKEICESGRRYNPANPTPGGCFQCLVGTYRQKDVDSPETCKTCPVPFSTQNPGAEDITYCVPRCAKGEYYNETRKRCENCSIGYYQNEEYNRYSCRKCFPPGTTTTAVGAVSQSSCTDVCGLGEELPIDGTEKADCNWCGIGSYKDATLFTCRRCQDGFTTSTIGSDSPDDCYRICKAGEDFDAGGTGCKPCARGYYRETPPNDTDSSCKPCPPGFTTEFVGTMLESLCKDLCNDGFDLSADKNSCEPCERGEYRKQGSNETECQSCDPGQTTATAGSATRDACQRNCTVGERDDNATNSCVQCEVGTYQDLPLQDSCKPCPSWKTTLGTGSDEYNDCIDPCTDGFQTVNDTCVQCSRGTYRKKDVQSSCQMCRSNFTTLAPGAATANQCVPICNPGYHWDENVDSCVRCENGTYNPIAYQLACLPCPSARPISSADFLSCQGDCKPGESWNVARQICNWCPPGFFSEGGSKVCQLCPSGTYSFLMGGNLTDCIAVNCAAGSYKENATAACQVCPAGTVSNATRTACVTCSVGQVPASDRGSCVIQPGSDWCPAGQENVTSTNCVNCRQGYYRPAGLRDVCQPCPKDQYQNLEGQASCINCPSTLSTLTTGSTSVSDCRADWCGGGKKPVGNSCIPCTAGTYKPEGFTGDCIQCPKNTYQPATSQTSCIDCPSQEQTKSKGSTNIGQCRSDWCGGGQQPSGDNCVPCSLGTYKPDNTIGNCRPCEVSTYQDEQGKTSCKPCTPDGYHTVVTGSISLSNCSADWCVGGMTFDKQKNKCRKCGFGKYRAVTDVGCQDCGTGVTYNLTATSTDDCKEACPAGSFINFNSGTCDECGQGTYSNMANTKDACIPCPSGLHTLGNGSTSLIMCKKNWCPGGRINEKGTKICGPCGFGKYRRFKLDRECIPCPHGLTTMTDTAASIDECISGVDPTTSGPTCSGGYVNEDGLCRPCPIGYYRIENTANHCTACPYGFTTRRAGSWDLNLCITMHSQCEERFDLVIAVDLSNSPYHDASRHVYLHLKPWLKCLIRRLDIHPYRVRVSIVKYAHGAATLVDLRNGYTAEKICSLIDKGLKPSVNMNVNTATALQRAYDIISQQGRPGVQKHVLLIMDDPSDNPARAAQIAKYLKDRRVHITVVGTDPAEVTHLASSSYSTFVFRDYLHLPPDYSVVRAVCRPRK